MRHWWFLIIACHFLQYMRASRRSHSIIYIKQLDRNINHNWVKFSILPGIVLRPITSNQLSHCKKDLNEQNLVANIISMILEIR